MTRKSAIATSALLLAVFPLAAIPPASAQTATEPPKSDSVHSDPYSWPIHTFFLKANDERTMSDVVYALKTALPAGTSITSIPTQKAIVARLNPADIPTVEKILADIDRPRKIYRVTYTLSEMDKNNRIGIQHFAVVMVPGQQTVLKQGSKVPVAEGNFGTGSGLGVQTQFTYMDVGVALEGTLQDMGTTGTLRYSIDQSSVAPQTSANSDIQRSVVRQTSLKGEATLTPGKPLMLGSLDFPSSTRRIDVEAVMEPLP